MMSNKEYLTKPWHINHFNNGYEIGYVGSDNVSNLVPLDGENDGLSKDLELIRHIVDLHNKSLSKD